MPIQNRKSKIQNRKLVVMVKIEEFEFPDELFYEPKEHMWLRPQADDVAGVRLILDFGFWILDFWRWSE